MVFKKTCALILTVLMLVGLCFGATGCSFLNIETDFVTKSDVQQMLNNSMGGNVTVEGGDDYNITINGVEQDKASASRKAEDPRT